MHGVRKTWWLERGPASHQVIHMSAAKIWQVSIAIMSWSPYQTYLAVGCVDGIFWPTVQSRFAIAVAIDTGIALKISEKFDHLWPISQTGRMMLDNQWYFRLPWGYSTRFRKSMEETQNSMGRSTAAHMKSKELYLMSQVGERPEVTQRVQGRTSSHFLLTRLQFSHVKKIRFLEASRRTGLRFFEDGALLGPLLAIEIIIITIYTYRTICNRPVPFSFYC